MLSVSNVSKSYGIKTVLQDISFTIKPGAHVSLVGPNGCGKTTLLRILTNQEPPDTGAVRFTPVSTTVGYLPQGIIFSEEETISDYLAHHRADTGKLLQRLENLALQLTTDTTDELVHEEYDLLLAQIEITAQNEHNVRTIMAGLGLDLFPAETPLRYLSGGQKTRLALAGVLVENPSFLILDEPTNHLDIEMLEWLESWLYQLPIALLIVSHDRVFLDHVAEVILELDANSHSIREYIGNYTEYLDKKASERQQQWQNYLDQQDEIGRLQHAAAHLRGIAKFRKGGKGDSGDKFAKGFFANRTLGTVGRAKHIEHRIDQLLHKDQLEKPGQTWQMKVEFGEIPSSGRDVVIIENASFGYPDYAPLVENVNLTLRYGERVAFIGPNGAGKTTVLRTVAGFLLPQKGLVRLGANVNLGYMAQEHENLDFTVNALISLATIRPLPETELRAYLSKFLFKGDDVFTPIEQMSYGERSRLALALLVARGCNLLMLDEPINHLDIPARVCFEEALANFDGTVLAVVHDRYFIAAFASHIWELKNHSILVR
jgi:ATP-binding cassette, subfamily F, member 3